MPKKSAFEIVSSSLDHPAIADLSQLEGALRDLIVEHANLIKAHDALAARLRKYEQSGETPFDGRAPAASGTLSNTQEEIYRYVIARAEKDPRILAILVNRPELRVTIERETIEARGNTLRGALGILIAEKFFDGSRKFADVRAELIRRGFLASKAPNRQISQAIEGLVELGFFTREDDGYQAVAGMKVHIIEAGKHEAGRAAAR